MAIALVVMVASTVTSSANPPGGSGGHAPSGGSANADPTFRDYRGQPGRDTVLGDLQEKVALRSQGMKVFDVPGGGAHFVQLFSDPVHYRDASGQWREIDTSLVRTAGGFRNGANAFDVFLPARMSESESLRLDVAGGSLAIAMKGARPSVAFAAEGRVTYPGIREGVAAEYSLNATGYKEDVLLSTPESPSTFTYDIRARGLTLDQQQDGRILVNGADGVAGVFPPLFVQEAPTETGAPGDASYDAVRATLRQTTPGSFELGVSIDRGWLEEEGRRYPVRLDPSFVASDCREPNTSCSGAGNGVPLLKDMYRTTPPGQSGYNIAGDAQIYAGKDYSISETFMTFDVGQEIRKVGDMVYNARFDIENYSNTSRDPYWAPIYRLHRITADWDQWSSLAPQVDESRVWSTYNPCADGDCGGGLSINHPNRWWKWDVSEIVRYWVDQGTGSNHGWRISATPGTYERDLRGFYPKEWTWDANSRPYLTVAVNAFPSTRPFTVDDPDFPYLDLASDASRNGAIVGSGVQPVLKIKDLTDSNLDPILVRYQVSKSPTNFSGTNLVHDSNWIPETHARSVNVDGWAPGVYYWRVEASDTCADPAFRDQDNAVERDLQLCDDQSHLGRAGGRTTSEVRTFMIEDPTPETRDCTAIETYCRGLVATSGDADDRENAARTLVPVSGPGEVVIVSANLRMAHCKIIQAADGSNICDGVPQDVTPGDKTDNEWEYKADQTPAARQRHFGRRMKILARRALGGGQFKDGVGAVPDVVLLQESWVRSDGRNDVEGIRQALSDKTGVPYRIAIQQTESEMTSTNKDMAEGTDVKIETKGDTAILYNARTMEAPIETGKITNTWDPESATGDRVICDDKSRALLELDLDGDGSRDCDTAQQKIQVYAGMYRKDTDGNPSTKGPLVAAASVHYVLDNDFKSDAVAEDYKAKWSDQIAAKLEQRFGASIYAIGGDFNAQRCPKREEPKVPLTNAERDPGVRERSVCQNPGGEEPFWKALALRGYTDSVYAKHGAPPAGTDTTLTKQYRDGVVPGTQNPQFRDVRIDSVYVRAPGQHLKAGSHDLSCGYYGESVMSNCSVSKVEQPYKYAYPAGCTCRHRIPTSPDRYSDHRLVWAMISPQR